jgi:hypothetical protein
MSMFTRRLEILDIVDIVLVVSAVVTGDLRERTGAVTVLPLNGRLDFRDDSDARDDRFTQCKLHGVGSELIEGIGHRHEHVLRRFLERNCPNLPQKIRRDSILHRRSLWVGLGGGELEIELIGQGLCEIPLGEHSELHQKCTQSLTAILLQATSLLKLLWLQLASFHQQLAEVLGQRPIPDRMRVACAAKDVRFRLHAAREYAAGVTRRDCARGRLRRPGLPPFPRARPASRRCRHPGRRYP